MNDRIVIDRILIFAILIYPFLLIWQGGDLTDTGFHAIYSQNFLFNLNEGNVDFKTILTDFVGNLWLKVFAGQGIWGLRLLGVLFIQGGMLLAFLTLKEIRPRTAVLAGLFCAQVFALRYTAMIFNYDYTSFFFLMLTAFCLWKGIRNVSHVWIIAAGLFSGVASLARFSDIAILSLVPFVFLQSGWAYQEKLVIGKIVWESVKKYAIFLFGFISFFCLFGIILIITDTWEVFSQKLYVLTDNLNGLDNSAYSFRNLIIVYLGDLKRFTRYLIGICTAVIVFCTVLQTMKKRVFLYTAMTICIGFAFFFFYGEFSYRNSFKYFVPGLCVIASIFAFLPHESDTKQYGSLIIIAWITAIVSFAGTNTGVFLKLCFGMPLLLPLLGALMWNRNIENMWRLQINWRPLVLTSGIIIILISGIIQFGWIYHVDSGLLSRFRALYPIEHILMRNIYTTAERSKHIEETTRAIERHIHPENSLFIYGHEPLFYYLSQQKPAIFNFWMSGMSTAETEGIFRQLDISIDKTSKYPLILITDKKCLGEKGSVLLEFFLKKHNYRCVECSENYQIWNTY